MVIDGYFINGYWCLLMAIILMTIDGILLVDIGGYSIGEYWWLFISIILMAIGGNYINGYW
jgi:uncharacterized membrane protein